MVLTEGEFICFGDFEGGSTDKVNCVSFWEDAEEWDELEEEEDEKDDEEEVGMGVLASESFVVVVVSGGAEGIGEGGKVSEKELGSAVRMVGVLVEDAKFILVAPPFARRFSGICDIDDAAVFEGGGTDVTSCIFSNP
jgi:hypothetical protein